MSTGFPDGGTVFLTDDAWPLVTVRFPDGGQVDFRAGSEWPRHARIEYRGLEVKGLRVDVNASIGPDGSESLPSWSISKTGVAGADGGADVPVKVQEQVTALCRRRVREARSALLAAGRGGEPVTCIRIVKHAIHCLGCGKAWVDEDEECTCTCTDPEMETWTVTELCADCGQPMDGHGSDGDG